MSQIILEGGNFAGNLVGDTGEDHRFVWSEQDGVRHWAAPHGPSVTYVDIYKKHIDSDGVASYKFIETT